MQYGISVDELDQRRRLQNDIQDILSQNSLVQKKEAAIVGGKAKQQYRRDKFADAIALDSSVVTPGEVAASSKGRSSSDEDVSGRFYLNDALEEAEVILEEAMPQAAFDQLYAQDDYALDERQQQKAAKKYLPRSLGRVEDLKLDSAYENVGSYTVSPLNKKTHEEKRKKCFAGAKIKGG